MNYYSHRVSKEYEKTDNLIRLFTDHEFLREMVTAEDECEEIGAGFPAYSYNPQPVDPEQMKTAIHKVQLLSLLFVELKAMMNQANLGAGTEAAILEARRRIHEKLEYLSTEQRSFFGALVAEELSALPNKPIHDQLRTKMVSLLSTADWDAIRQEATNALQIHFVEFLASTKSVNSQEKEAHE
jgi:hypothetical protein